MQERRSFYLLMAIMGVVALVTMSVTNVILYQVAFNEKSQSLVQTAQSQARLIEAMARYNRRTNRIDWETPVGERGPTSLLSVRAASDTISQLKDAHKHYLGFGQTGEFVLAGIEGENIVFLLRHRHDVSEEPNPLPLYSENAEPMRRALLAESGVMVGKDYRGVNVLAAYEPVDVLNFGIVAKIDMSEIRAPFIKGAIYTCAIAIMMILLGSILFRRITTPIITRIRDSEYRYRSLVEEINEWVWVVDKGGVITYSSPYLESLLGYEYQEVVGRRLIDLVEKPSKDNLPKSFQGHPTLTHAVSDIELQVKTTQGEPIVLELSAAPVYTQEREFNGYRGVARNISERKHAEQLQNDYQHKLEQEVTERTDELREINEELKNFTYIVSHDLRSPLVSIVGFSSEVQYDVESILAESKTALFSTQASERLVTIIPESLNYINKAAEKMEGLITNILELSRIGRRSIDFELVNSAEIVDKNLKALAYQLDKVKVVPRNLPELYSDELALEQIFGNLLGNAVKFLQKDRAGEIEIWADKEQSYWHFFVKDNGCGIAEKDIPHVFEIFRRLGAQDVLGEGMGLTYVQTLVRRLGGRIKCESILGEGTTFSFSLPVAQNDE